MTSTTYPSGYMRSSLRTADLVRVMRGRGWLSLTEIMGMAAAKISPENALRIWRYHAARRAGKRQRGPVASIEKDICRGRRTVINHMLLTAKRTGKIQHKPGTKNREPMFRFVEEAQEATRNGKKKAHAKKAPARRRHAAKSVD